MKKEELAQVCGGIKISLISGIVTGITFLIGIFDGYFRPLKCNK